METVNIFAKQKSIKRLNSDNMDVHGNLFHERILLDVVNVNLSTQECDVVNPHNGLKGTTKIKKLVFCDENGLLSDYKKEINSLSKQIAYCNEAICFNGIEEWEKKEYHAVKLGNMKLKIQLVKLIKLIEQ